MANFLLVIAALHNPHRAKRQNHASERKENTESRVGLESNLAESQADSEFKERLDSHFDNLDSKTESNSIDSKDSQKQNLESSFLESNQLTESTTSKNLIKALPNLNSVRVSASRAESMPIDSAIFAEQKSHKMCSAAAHTTPRPLRGVQSLEKGGATASATIALEAEIARLSRQKIYFVAAQKAAAFSGLGRAGRGEYPFLRKNNAIHRI